MRGLLTRRRSSSLRLLGAIGMVVFCTVAFTSWEQTRLLQNLVKGGSASNLVQEDLEEVVLASDKKEPQEYTEAEAATPEEEGKDDVTSTSIPPVDDEDETIFHNDVVDHFCSLPLVVSAKASFSSHMHLRGRGSSTNSASGRVRRPPQHPQLLSLTLEQSSAHKIWHHFISDIFQLSIDNDDQVWHNFIHQLLDFVTPKMKNTVKNLRK